MAGSSLFMLVDDIALMTKVAAPKSAEVTSRRA
ncbi:MAG: putative DNA repair protein MutK [Reinekea sp.]|jgi:predicted DNA repair protein MutK